MGGNPGCSPASTGMFAYWICYGIRDCSDGTSQTIAYAESLVGDASGPTPCHRNNNTTGATGAAPVEAFDASKLSSTNVVDPGDQRLQHVLHGSSSVSAQARSELTPAVAGVAPARRCPCSIRSCTPNSKTALRGTRAPTLASVARGFLAVSNAQSNHPGGVNILLTDGSARVYQGHDQPADVDELGHARNNSDIVDGSEY